MTKTAKLIVAGVDVGGTNIEVGLVTAEHGVVARAKVSTPTGGPSDVMDAIAELVTSLGERPAAVGVGIPGVVHEGKVLTVPNLENWHEHVEVDTELADRLGLPVALGNDADVGLLGEWLAGAAQSSGSTLGIWIGTGIGGGMILDGRPYRGSRGAAGEIGHVIIRADGALCGCGRRGCVEAYAGRRSLSATASSLAEAGRPTKLFDIQQKVGKTKLTSKVWARALKEGDAVAIELIDTAIASIGIGLGSSLNLLDVELVVVGGGLAEKLGQSLADRIEAATRPWVLQPNPELKFVVSDLADDAGVVGAAALGRAMVIGT